MIAVSAQRQVGRTIIYDPAYVRLAYPMGDIPLERGVCTDVVIRALRSIGVDLQKEIHEDRSANFDDYPNRNGMKVPDRNIDHRRVEYIMRYMERQGKRIATNESYIPGDIVAWRLKSGRLHIGVVSQGKAMASVKRYTVIHNIGAGACNEDVLYAYSIIGHYRW